MTNGVQFSSTQSIPTEGAAILLLKPSRELHIETSKWLASQLQLDVSAIRTTYNYEAKYGEMLVVHTMNQKVKHLVLVGIGEETLSEVDFVKLGGLLCTTINSNKINSCFILPALDDDKLAAVALGMQIKDFQFLKYFTKDENSKKRQNALKDVRIVSANGVDDALALNQRVCSALSLAKTLAMEPANVINPRSFAQKCSELADVGVAVETLGEREMSELGFNTLLGVGQGSKNESQLVVMRWNGNDASKEVDVAIVGKGVTFDTGGLSLKPADSMIGMKGDKTGAAVVTGLLQLLASRKAKVNAVGVIGLVENMPGGNAQRPEDIVKSLSGQTVEILNTDAEGRLVLADALWYAQDRFKPKMMLDIATLTGAVRIALGREYAGLFSNNDKIAESLYEAGVAVDEKVWRLPLHKEYDKAMNSKVADVQNISSGRTGAGSITAAQFLQRFVNQVPWAHIDIAAVDALDQASDLHSAGSSAFGLMLLNRFIRDWYESGNR